MSGDLLTRQQIIERIAMMKLHAMHTDNPYNSPVTFHRIPGQVFFVLRVDEENECYYTNVLGYHPITRMSEPGWKCVDFIVNAEMEA